MNPQTSFTDVLHKRFFQRFIASLTSLFLCLTQLYTYTPSVFAAPETATAHVRIRNSVPASLPPSATATLPETLRLLSTSARPQAILVPSGLGTVQELHAGKSNLSVIYLQDAHGVGTVQHSLRRLIEFYQHRYGAQAVVLEGAAGRLDAALLRAYPDHRELERVISGYLDRGELSGAAAAAILSRHEMPYSGIEDWKLYEESLRVYLEARNREAELKARLAPFEETLKAQQEKFYSNRAKKLSAVLTDLHASPGNFEEALKVLTEIRKPSAASYPMLTALMAAAEESREDTPAAHARARRKLKRITGPDFLREFSRYAEEVKKEVFRSPREKRLWAWQEEMQRVRDFSALELSREDWKVFSNAGENAKSAADLSWDQFRNSLKTDYPQHFRFYELALARDQHFLKAIKQTAADTGARTLILVAGGFHTSGLTEGFRKEEISYLVASPAVKTWPDEVHYADYMRGRVSWRRHFQMRGGKIDLFSSFMRAATADLIQVPAPLILKRWRDALIQKLAGQKKLEYAGRYTRFLDEAAAQSADPAELARIRKEWSRRLEAFLRRMRMLEQKGPVTGPAVRGLLSPAAQKLLFPYAAAVLQPGAEIFDPAAISRRPGLPGPDETDEVKLSVKTRQEKKANQIQFSLDRYLRRMQGRLGGRWKIFAGVMMISAGLIFSRSEVRGGLINRFLIPLALRGAEHLASGSFSDVFWNKRLFSGKVISVSRSESALRSSAVVRMPRQHDAGIWEIYRDLRTKTRVSGDPWVPETQHALQIPLRRLSFAAMPERLRREKERFGNVAVDIYLQERGLPLSSRKEGEAAPLENYFQKSEIYEALAQFTREFWRAGYIDLDLKRANYLARLVRGKPAKGADGRPVVLLHDFDGVFRLPETLPEILAFLRGKTRTADVSRGVMLLRALTRVPSAQDLRRRWKYESGAAERLFPDLSLESFGLLIRAAEDAAFGRGGSPEEKKAVYLRVLAEKRAEIDQFIVQAAGRIAQIRSEVRLPPVPAQKQVLAGMAHMGFREVLARELAHRIEKNPHDEIIPFLWEQMLDQKALPNFASLNRKTEELQRHLNAQRYAPARVLLEELAVYEALWTHFAAAYDWNRRDAFLEGARVTHPRFAAPLEIIKVLNEETAQPEIQVRTLEKGRVRLTSDPDDSEPEGRYSGSIIADQGDLFILKNSSDIRRFRFNQVFEAPEKLRILRESLAELSAPGIAAPPHLNSREIRKRLQKQLTSTDPDHPRWTNFTGEFELSPSGRLTLKYRRGKKRHAADINLRDAAKEPVKVLMRMTYSPEHAYHLLDFAWNEEGKRDLVTATFRLARDDAGEPDFALDNPFERVSHPAMLRQHNARTAREILDRQILEADPESEIWNKTTEAQVITNYKGIYPFGTKVRRVFLPFNFGPYTPVAMIWRNQATPMILRQFFTAVPVTPEGTIAWDLMRGGPRYLSVSLKGKNIFAKRAPDTRVLRNFLAAHLRLDPQAEAELKPLRRLLVHTAPNRSVISFKWKNGREDVFHTGVKGAMLVSGQVDAGTGIFYYEIVPLNADFQPDYARRHLYRLRRNQDGKVDRSKNVIEPVDLKARQYPGLARVRRLIQQQLEAQDPSAGGFEDFEELVPTDANGKFVISYHDAGGRRRHAVFSTGLTERGQIRLGRRADPSVPAGYVFRAQVIYDETQAVLAPRRLPDNFYHVRMRDGRFQGTVFRQFPYGGDAWRRSEVRTSESMETLRQEIQAYLKEINQILSEDRARYFNTGTYGPDIYAKLKTAFSGIPEIIQSAMAERSRHKSLAALRDAVQNTAITLSVLKDLAAGRLRPEVPVDSFSHLPVIAWYTALYRGRQYRVQILGRPVEHEGNQARFSVNIKDGFWNSVGDFRIDFDHGRAVIDMPAPLRAIMPSRGWHVPVREERVPNEFKAYVFAMLRAVKYRKRKTMQTAPSKAAAQPAKRPKRLEVTTEQTVIPPRMTFKFTRGTLGNREFEARSSEELAAGLQALGFHPEDLQIKLREDGAVVLNLGPLNLKRATVLRLDRNSEGNLKIARHFLREADAMLYNRRIREVSRPPTGPLLEISPDGTSARSEVRAKKQALSIDEIYFQNLVKGLSIEELKALRNLSNLLAVFMRAKPWGFSGYAKEDKQTTQVLESLQKILRKRKDSGWVFNLTPGHYSVYSRRGVAAALAGARRIFEDHGMQAHYDRILREANGPDTWSFVLRELLSREPRTAENFNGDLLRGIALGFPPEDADYFTRAYKTLSGLPVSRPADAGAGVSIESRHKQSYAWMADPARAAESQQAMERMDQAVDRAVAVIDELIRKKEVRRSKTVLSLETLHGIVRSLGIEIIDESGRHVNGLEVNGNESLGFAVATDNTHMHGAIHSVESRLREKYPRYRLRVVWDKSEPNSMRLEIMPPSAAPRKPRSEVRLPGESEPEILRIFLQGSRPAEEQLSGLSLPAGKKVRLQPVTFLTEHDEMLRLIGFSPIDRKAVPDQVLSALAGGNNIADITSSPDSQTGQLLVIQLRTPREISGVTFSELHFAFDSGKSWANASRKITDMLRGEAHWKDETNLTSLEHHLRRGWLVLQDREYEIADEAAAQTVAAETGLPAESLLDRRNYEEIVRRREALAREEADRLRAAELQARQEKLAAEAALKAEQRRQQDEQRRQAEYLAAEKKAAESRESAADRIRKIEKLFELLNSYRVLIHEGQWTVVEALFANALQPDLERGRQNLKFFEWLRKNRPMDEAALREGLEAWEELAEIHPGAIGEKETAVDYLYRFTAAAAKFDRNVDRWTSWIKKWAGIGLATAVTSLVLEGIHSAEAYPADFVPYRLTSHFMLFLFNWAHFTWRFKNRNARIQRNYDEIMQEAHGEMPKRFTGFSAGFGRGIQQEILQLDAEMDAEQEKLEKLKESSRDSDRNLQKQAAAGASRVEEIFPEAKKLANKIIQQLRTAQKNERDASRMPEGEFKTQEIQRADYRRKILQSLSLEILELFDRVVALEDEWRDLAHLPSRREERDQEFPSWRIVSGRSEVRVEPLIGFGPGLPEQIEEAQARLSWLGITDALRVLPEESGLPLWTGVETEIFRPVVIKGGTLLYYDHPWSYVSFLVNPDLRRIYIGEQYWDALQKDPKALHAFTLYLQLQLGGATEAGVEELNIDAVYNVLAVTDPEGVEAWRKIDERFARNQLKWLMPLALVALPFYLLIFSVGLVVGLLNLTAHLLHSAFLAAEQLLFEIISLGMRPPFSRALSRRLSGRDSLYYVWQLQSWRARRWIEAYLPSSWRRRIEVIEILQAEGPEEMKTRNTAILLNKLLFDPHGEVRRFAAKAIQEADSRYASLRDLQLVSLFDTHRIVKETAAAAHEMLSASRTESAPRRAEVRSAAAGLPDELKLKLAAANPDLIFRFDSERAPGYPLKDPAGNIVAHEWWFAGRPGASSAVLAVRIGSWLIIDSEWKARIEPLVEDGLEDLRAHLIYRTDFVRLLDYEFNQKLDDYVVPMAMAIDSLDLSGKTVVDLGSADGLLSLMAYKKGAQRIVSVDLDPKAGPQMLKHLEANGIPAGPFHFLQGDLAAGKNLAGKADGIFDAEVILANIAEHPIYTPGTHLRAADWIDFLPRVQTFVAGGYVPDQKKFSMDRHYQAIVKALAEKGFNESVQFVNPTNFGSITAAVFTRAPRSEVRTAPEIVEEVLAENRTLESLLTEVKIPGGDFVLRIVPQSAGAVSELTAFDLRPVQPEGLWRHDLAGMFSRGLVEEFSISQNGRILTVRFVSPQSFGGAGFLHEIHIQFRSRRISELSKSFQAIFVNHRFGLPETARVQAFEAGLQHGELIEQVYGFAEQGTVELLRELIPGFAPAAQLSEPEYRSRLAEIEAEERRQRAAEAAAVVKPKPVEARQYPPLPQIPEEEIGLPPYGAAPEGWENFLQPLDDRIFIADGDMIDILARAHGGMVYDSSREDVDPEVARQFKSLLAKEAAAGKPEAQRIAAHLAASADPEGLLNRLHRLSLDNHTLALLPAENLREIRAQAIRHLFYALTLSSFNAVLDQLPEFERRYLRIVILLAANPDSEIFYRDFWQAMDPLIPGGQQETPHVWSALITADRQNRRAVSRVLRDLAGPGAAAQGKDLPLNVFLDHLGLHDEEAAELQVWRERMQDLARRYPGKTILYPAIETVMNDLRPQVLHRMELIRQRMFRLQGLADADAPAFMQEWHQLLEDAGYYAREWERFKRSEVRSADIAEDKSPVLQTTEPILRWPEEHELKFVHTFNRAMDGENISWADAQGNEHSALSILHKEPQSSQDRTPGDDFEAVLSFYPTDEEIERHSELSKLRRETHLVGLPYNGSFGNIALREFSWGGEPVILIRNIQSSAGFHSLDPHEKEIYGRWREAALKKIMQAAAQAGYRHIFVNSHRTIRKINPNRTLKDYFAITDENLYQHYIRPFRGKKEWEEINLPYRSLEDIRSYWHRDLAAHPVPVRSEVRTGYAALQFQKPEPVLLPRSVPSAFDALPLLDGITFQARNGRSYALKMDPGYSGWAGHFGITKSYLVLMRELASGETKGVVSLSADETGQIFIAATIHARSQGLYKFLYQQLGNILPPAYRIISEVNNIDTHKALERGRKIEDTLLGHIAFNAGYTSQNLDGSESRNMPYLTRRKNETAIGRDLGRLLLHRERPFSPAEEALVRSFEAHPLIQDYIRHYNRWDKIKWDDQIRSRHRLLHGLPPQIFDSLANYLADGKTIRITGGIPAGRIAESANGDLLINRLASTYDLIHLPYLIQAANGTPEAEARAWDFKTYAFLKAVRELAAGDSELKDEGLAQYLEEMLTIFDLGRTAAKLQSAVDPVGQKFLLETGLPRFKTLESSIRYDHVRHEIEKAENLEEIEAGLPALQSAPGAGEIDGAAAEAVLRRLLPLIRGRVADSAAYAEWTVQLVGEFLRQAFRSEVRSMPKDGEALDLSKYQLPQGLRTFRPLSAHEARIFYVMATGDVEAFFGRPRESAVNQQHVNRFFQHFTGYQGIEGIQAIFDEYFREGLMPLWKMMKETEEWKAASHTAQNELRELFRQYVQAFYTIADRIFYAKALIPHQSMLHRLEPVDEETDVLVLETRALDRIFMGIKAVYSNDGLIFEMRDGMLTLVRRDREETGFRMEMPVGQTYGLVEPADDFLTSFAFYPVLQPQILIERTLRGGIDTLIIKNVDPKRTAFVSWKLGAKSEVRTGKNSLDIFLKQPQYRSLADVREETEAVLRDLTGVSAEDYLGRLFVLAHFELNPEREDLILGTLSQFRGYPAVRNFLREAVEFGGAADTDPAAEKFMRSLGRSAAAGYLRGMEKMPQPSYTKLAQPGTEKLPYLDLAAGTNVLHYIEEMAAAGGPVILADKSAFVTGLLEEAKKILGVGSHVVIRQADAGDVKNVFKEKAYRLVTLSNADLYVPDLGDDWYRELMSRIPENGAVVVAFPAVYRLVPDEMLAASPSMRNLLRLTGESEDNWGVQFAFKKIENEGPAIQWRHLAIFTRLPAGRSEVRTEVLRPVLENVIGAGQAVEGEIREFAQLWNRSRGVRWRMRALLRDETFWTGLAVKVMSGGEVWAAENEGAALRGSEKQKMLTGASLNDFEKRAAANLRAGLHFAFAMPAGHDENLQAWQLGLFEKISGLKKNRRVTAKTLLLASAEELNANPVFFESLKRFDFVEVLVTDQPGTVRSLNQFLALNPNALAFALPESVSRQVARRHQLVQFEDILLWQDVFALTSPILVRAAGHKAGITAEFLRKVPAELFPQGGLEYRGENLVFLSAARRLAQELSAQQLFASMA